jgi:hypothetical protein
LPGKQQETSAYLGASDALIEIIADHYDYKIQFSHPGTDGIELLTSLPSSLARDVSAHLFQGLVSKVR